MTDTITLPRAVIEQALSMLDGAEQMNSLRPEKFEIELSADEIDALSSTLRAALAQQATVNTILTWDRRETKSNAPDKIMDAMQAEIDELRAVLSQQQALQVAQQAEQVQFLSDGTRFKVCKHEGDEASRIYGLPRELNGKWVALVAADDDCHLKLAAAPKGGVA